ncbi:MAG: fluoride efflux transporter CrcB [Phycisphaerales bacterium]
MIGKLALIGLAGGLGALCRHGLAGLMQRGATPEAFPIGTFAVNMLGCLLFGVVWSATETRLGLAPELRIIALTGFMGAFTTFSTFAFENTQLLREGAWLLAGGNIIGQNALGVALIFVGLKLGSLI